MTRSLRPACGTFKAAQSHPSSVWISDAQLAYTWDRFTRSHRRHGSSVPGPLEARRRASKRKNTNLAQAGSIPPIDPSVLLGAGPRQAWWKPLNAAPKPRLQESTEPPPNLTTPSPDRARLIPRFVPSWLSKPPPAPVPVADSIERKSSNADTLRRFSEALETSPDLESLKDLSQRLELKMNQEPIYSMLAFKHILSKDYTLVAEFLLDPSLRSPAALYYSAIISELSLRALEDAERLDYLLGVIYQGISVGLVSREQLGQVIQNSWKIKVKQDGHTHLLRDMPSIHMHYSAIVKALEDCKVFSVKDLGKDLLLQWTDIVYKSRMGRTAAQLILSLQRYVAGFNEPGLQHRLAFRAVAVWLQQSTQSSESVGGGTDDLVWFLHQQPVNIRSEILFSMAENLATTFQVAEKHAVLELWRTVLEQSGDSAWVTIPDTEASWLEGVKVDSLVKAKQQLLLRLWTSQVLSDKFRKTRLPTTLQTALWRFVQGDGSAQPQAAYRGIIDGLPLTASAQHWLKDVMRIYIEEEHKQVLRQNFAEQRTQTVQANAFLTLQDDDLYYSKKTFVPELLKDLSHSTNTDFATFGDTVIPFIVKDKMSFKIVTRLLTNNQELKIALARSWTVTPPTPALLERPGQNSPPGNSNRRLLPVEQARMDADLIRSEIRNFLMADKQSLVLPRAEPRMRAFVHVLASKLRLNSSKSRDSQAKRQSPRLHKSGRVVLTKTTQTQQYSRATISEFDALMRKFRFSDRYQGDFDPTTQDAPAGKNEAISPTQEPQSPCESSLGTAALGLIHKLALAFAVSPAIHQRQALRKVYWCYQFLHRYGAPIQPSLTKALWYAAVVRRSDTGPGPYHKRVYHWVMRAVQRVEGYQTFEMLRTSPDFRKARTREVLRAARNLLSMEEETPDAAHVPKKRARR